MSNKKLRAITHSNNEVGKQRYQLYKAAFEWIEKCLDAGFYLEAISLEESLIADRLESRLSQIKGENYAVRGQII